MDGLDRTRGERLRRSAVAALALSGILAGCGLGEPKQTYEQAYEAMRPDAMAAMKEAWPGVEMAKDSGGTEERRAGHQRGQGCEQAVGARDLSGKHPAGGRAQPCGVGASGRETTAGAWVAQWRRGENTGRGGLKFSVKSSSRVRLQMEKPGVDGWAVVLVYADEPNDYGVSMSVSTKCLRNPAWGNGEEG
ncbi:hypothetical protein ACF1B4_25840 [Streptomyces albidoflavus]